jgi:hypothetical protein
MVDFTNDPTEDIVNSALDHLSSVWRNTWEVWEKLDQFFNLEYPVWDQPGQQQNRGSYRPSTPNSIVTHAADNHFAFIPRISRDAVGEGETHKRDADLLETSVNAVILDSALQETVIPYKQAARHFLQYAYTVLEGPVLDFGGHIAKPRAKNFRSEKAFKAEEVKYAAHRKNWNPIRIRATHPARVLLDPEEQTPPFAIKKSSVTAWKLRERSIQKAGSRPGAVEFTLSGDETDFSSIDIIDWWTVDHHAVQVAGKNLLWKEKNPLGYIPFSHAFAGAGMQPSNATSFDPKYFARGILWSIMDSLKMEARMGSAKATALFKRAFASLVTDGNSTELAAQLARDGIIEYDGEMGIVPTPGVERWMFEIGNEVKDDIEHGTFQRDLSGRRQPGVDTVGQQAILSNASTARFGETKVWLNQLASVVIGRVLQLVDQQGVLDGHITVRGKRLQKQHIHGVYGVEAAFEVIDPVLQLQIREAGMREVQLGLKSKETYWEMDARLADVTKEKDRLLAQHVREHPGVHNQLALVQAQSEGLGPEFEAALKEEELAAQDGRTTAARQNGAGGIEGLRDPLSNNTVAPSRTGQEAQ